MATDDNAWGSPTPFKAVGECVPDAAGQTRIRRQALRGF
jgi:hypothetical protein